MPSCSDKPITGGQAFPCEGGPTSGLHPSPGMDLRDWFAGMALQGLVSSGLCTIGSIATFAYEYADEMIAERDRA